MSLSILLGKLWQQYSDENPSVKKVYNLLTEEGDVIVNDHIALRTFDNPNINIDVLAKEFLALGYVQSGEYHFEEKKLFAKHYQHKSDKNAPRVFISQLKTKEFSPFLNEVVEQIIGEIKEEQLLSTELVCSGRLWSKPSFEVYEKLRAESEYAAWLYVNGFKANHFTVSINHLKYFTDIYKLNDFLKISGFVLNNPSNEVQGTPEELLEQSSIKADMIQMEFQEGIKEVTSCYYEFAKRYPDENGELFSGFIAKSADKIFESTDLWNKDKEKI
jgi:hypothetical protein